MYPHQPPGQDLNIGLMLGRLLQGQETVVSRLDRIDRRLETGETWMQAHDQRSEKIEAAVAKLEKRPEIGRTERLIKQGLQWAIPGGVLWWTGSIEQAIKVLQAMGTAAK